MQKLTGISSGKNNKSCRIIHHESNKTGFTFFWLFCDFLRNLQETGKLTLLFQLHFCSRDPGKNFGFAKWPLGAAGRRGWAKSGELAGARGRGRTGGGSMDHRGSVWVVIWPLQATGAWRTGGCRGQHCGAAGARRSRRGAAREREGEILAHTREERPLISLRRTPDSCGRTDGLPGAPSVVRRRDVLGGFGMRAAWGRSKLRWEGARGPREARVGSKTEVASAGARRRAPARRARSRQNFARTASVRNSFSPNFWIEVQHVVNRKVEDLTTLYNFCKGRIVFFSTDLAGTPWQLWMPACPCEQEVLSVNQVFTNFHPKFEMPIYMKVVSLNEMDNFHKGRFWTV
jgi:hypothetical protein